jgi:hypothetical protein
MAGHTKDGEQSIGLPDLTPASTREGTPAPVTASTSEPEARGNIVQSMKTLDFGGKKETKGATTSEVAAREAVAEQVPPPLNDSMNKPPNPFVSSLLQGQHHLEAYILRPHVDTLNHSMTWFFFIDQLSLDYDALKAHVDKLDPTTPSSTPSPNCFHISSSVFKSAPHLATVPWSLFSIVFLWIWSRTWARFRSSRSSL